MSNDMNPRFFKKKSKNKIWGRIIPVTSMQILELRGILENNPSKALIITSSSDPAPELDKTSTFGSFPNS